MQQQILYNPNTPRRNINIALQTTNVVIAQAMVLAAQYVQG
jgi:hypothetical protein